jgi:hypothetical protein
MYGCVAETNVLHGAGPSAGGCQGTLQELGITQSKPSYLFKFEVEKW